MNPLVRRRRSGWRKWRGAIAFALAILFHGAFVTLLLVLSVVELNLPHPHRPIPPQQVSMRGISAQQWAQNRTPLSERAALPLTPPPPEKPRPKQTHPRGQVVDVAPGNRQESEDAKYLAESSNKVDKEQRSREQSAFYRNAMPRRTDSTARQGEGSDETHSAAGNGGTGAEKRPAQPQSAQSSKAENEIPATQKREEIAMKLPANARGPGANVGNRDESVEMKGNSNRLRVKPGEAGGGKSEASTGMAGTPGVASLTPSMAVLDKIVGAAPNDRLKDVDEGEGTYLNTREWKYSSFFNRVKQSVGLHWDPSSYLRQRDPTGNIYGGKDRYTVLDVTLTDRGMVKEISVQKSSGIDFLDLAAIASFEKAQPFPNPPPGLVTADATVQFTFGFFLEMGGSPRLRMFRQAN